MNEIPEQTALELTKIIAERGYVVFAAYSSPLIGEVIPSFNSGGIRQKIVPHPFRVIAHTDRADWETQCRLIGNYSLDAGERSFFYRAITD